jgi:hypothetical protein
MRWPGPESVSLRASVGSTEASESLLARVGVGGPKRAKGKKDRHGFFGTGREARRLSVLARWRANGIHLTRSLPAQKGVPAPSVRKPTVRTADEGCSGPVLRQNPPSFKPGPETLRIILACNPPCAQSPPTSRRIVRNKACVYPRGQHGAEYRFQCLSKR